MGTLLRLHEALNDIEEVSGGFDHGVWQDGVVGHWLIVFVFLGCFFNGLRV